MNIFYAMILAAVIGSSSISGSETHQRSQRIECTLKRFNRSAIRARGIAPSGVVDTAIRTNLFDTAISTNWSGYVGATNLSRPATNAVTAVSGSWTVPTLHSTPVTAYSAMWVGIDGFSNGTVEQLGTAQDWVSGKQQNYAWFEMYPQGSYEIVGFPVHNGDVIFAEVVYAGSGIFELIIENLTRRVYFDVPTSYTRSTTAQRSSAEWVAEAPSSNTGILPLADFGTVTFTDCKATISGVAGTISNSHWKNEAIEMETSTRVVKALPSSLYGSGQDFMVAWKHD